MASSSGAGTAVALSTPPRRLAASLLRRRWHVLPYLVALPIVIYETVFVMYPILRGMMASFTYTDIAGLNARWAGLANFQRMFSDPAFYQALWTTAQYAAWVIVAGIGLGLLTALLFNHAFIGRPVARALLMLPWAFPDVPALLAFIWILDPSFGILNSGLRMFGIISVNNPSWLNAPTTAKAAVVIISVWKAFPFYSLVLLAALQGVPYDLYEAAKVDGASAVQLFRYVTLPGILTTLQLLVILAFIFAFKQFTIIYLLTGGGPGTSTETLVLRIYNAAFRFYDYSYSAVLGVAGFMITIVVTTLFVMIQNRRRKEMG